MKVIDYIGVSIVYVLFMISNNIAKADIYKAADGALIDYEVTGNGKPLVLLHSGMMSREDMRTQINHFAKNYMVIAIDSRGQGRSSSTNTQISYELMAADVLGVLDQLKVKQAHFFGQSDGAITALLMSLYHPERIIKLIIHGAVFNHSAYPAMQKETWKNITWNKDDNVANDPANFPGMAIDHYLLGRNDLSGFEAHLKEMAMMWATSPNLIPDDLAGINIPTLVIVGDHYDISISHTLEIHEALPNSELFVVPGATHFVHQEKPALLHKVIDDFLQKNN